MMNTMPEKPIKLSIFSFPQHLCVVRATVEKLCQTMGFDAETSGAVVLSVDEALANIIKHAYLGAEGRGIEIELLPIDEGQSQGLRICLRDYGQRVDPARIKSRDLRDVRPGGLGVHIMQECMDSIEFAPAEGGGTLLTMVKNIPVRQEATK